MPFAGWRIVFASGTRFRPELTYAASFRRTARCRRGTTQNAAHTVLQ